MSSGVFVYALNDTNAGDLSLCTTANKKPHLVTYTLADWASQVRWMRPYPAVAHTGGLNIAAAFAVISYLYTSPEIVNT